MRSENETMFAKVEKSRQRLGRVFVDASRRSPEQRKSSASASICCASTATPDAIESPLAQLSARHLQAGRSDVFGTGADEATFQRSPTRVPEPSRSSHETTRDTTARDGGDDKVGSRGGSEPARDTSGS